MSYKIIHCSDIHLESSLKTNFGDSEKIHKRNREILQTFLDLINFAGDNHIGAILIAGDLFDTKKNNLDTVQKINKCIKKNPNVEIIYINGNHDEKNNYLDKLISCSNFHIFKENEFSDIQLNGGKIKVYGRMINTFNPLVYQTLKTDKSTFNILLAHGELKESADMKNDEEIPLKIVRKLNIDYLALGHYHFYKKGDLNSKLNSQYAYSGCLEGRGFDEPGKNGYILLTIEDNNDFDLKFIEGNGEVISESIDVSKCATNTDVEDLIENVIKGRDGQNILCEITLVGKVPEGVDFDVNAIENEFESRFNVFKVKNKTELDIDVTQYEKGKSLKSVFYQLVMKSNLDDETKQKILKLGIETIVGAKE